MIKTLSSLVFCVAVVGCASVEPESLKQVNIGINLGEPAQFNWVDQRSAEEKQTRLDPSVGSGNQLFILGDDKVSPPPADLMRAWLQQTAGNRLSGRSVSLDKFELRIFDPSVSVDQERLFTASASVPGGLIAAPLAGAFIYGIEKMRREIGVYTNIHIAINGTAIFAQGERKYRGSVSEKEIAQSVQVALDDLASKIEIHLPTLEPATIELSSITSAQPGAPADAAGNSSGSNAPTPPGAASSR
ncbi:hypothetical protein [Hydrogenophaga sp.]|uniref:hypothetical protein n=1 Tax=Hydrogenophaga sp. TaxID=1904254 RepID=UPI0025C04650|nr:hypothetical protein [Hydrogenophaga sp.]